MAFNSFTNQVPSFLSKWFFWFFFLFSMNWYNHSLAQASVLLFRWAIWLKVLVLGFYKQQQVLKCFRNSRWWTPLRGTPGRIENNQTPYSQSEAKTRHWHSFLFAVLNICVFTLRLVLKQLDVVWEAFENLESQPSF